MTKQFLIICLLSFALNNALCQNGAGVEQGLLQAKQLEHAGKRLAARKQVYDLLQSNPSYNEARIFYGQLLAFDQEYGKAASELEAVLKNDPANHDAYLALGNVYLWSHANKESIATCDSGLVRYPADAGLTLVKSRAFEQMGDYRTARILVLAILDKDPANNEAKALRERLDEKLRFNQLSVYYYFTHFAGSAAPAWHNSSIEYQRNIKRSSLITRVNQAYRFNINALQVEVDAYPKFGKRYYAYLNAGYSPEVRLFPTFRAGAEFYAGLPKGFEASLGGRVLTFDTSTTWLLTGYVGLYYKRYWFGYRPFVNVQPDKVYQSHIVTARCYGKTEDDYLTLTLSNGNIPFLIAWSQDLQRVSSNRAGIDVQKKFRRGFLCKTGVSYEYEEFYPGSFRNRLTGWLAFIKRF